MSLAVTGGLTRVMALPAVEVWLATFLPWLAAEPKSDDDGADSDGIAGGYYGGH